MRTREEIWHRLNELSAEIEELRREIILQKANEPALRDRAADEGALADLHELIKEISEAWTGPGAVEEIRNQREKPYGSFS